MGALELDISRCFPKQPFEPARCAAVWQMMVERLHENAGEHAADVLDPAQRALGAKPALADQPVQLAATDDVPALHWKLQTALGGVALDEVAAMLAASGARRISVMLGSDPHEPAPVSAIFGLRRGLLRNDLRVMLLATLDIEQHLDQITAVQVFPK